MKKFLLTVTLFMSVISIVLPAISAGDDTVAQRYFGEHY